MKKLIFIAIVLITMTVCLHAQDLEFEYTDFTNLDIPYPFSTVMYECDSDTLLHFYSVELNYDSSLYVKHFTLNSHFEFSEITTIVSSDISSTGITVVSFHKMIDSDTFFIKCYDDTRSVEKLIRISNFDTETACVDITNWDSSLSLIDPISDNTLAVLKRYNDLPWEDRYTEYYSYNISSQNFTLVKSNQNSTSYLFILGNEALIFEENINSEYNALHYDSEFCFTDTLLNNSGYIPERIYSVSKLSNGYLVSSYRGLKENPNKVCSQWLIDSEKIDHKTIGMYYRYSVISDSSIVGFYRTNSLYDDMEEYSLRYSECINGEWNASELIPTTLYSVTSLNYKNYIVMPYFTNEVVNIMVFNKHLELLDQKDLNYSGRFAESRGYILFDKIFFIDNKYNNELMYASFDVVVPNTENVSPELKSIATSNYPNPFNPITTIEYSVPQDGNVSIDIYNILGQKVNTLVNSVHSKGMYSIQWDGKDNNNKELPSGIYFYRISQNGKSVTKKIVMMK